MGILRDLRLLVLVWWEVVKAFFALFSKPSRKSIVDEVVLLTGGARSIGRETALLLGSLGAKVAIVDLNEDGAVETANEITKQGGTAIGLRCDVTKEEDVRSAVTEVRSKLGDITILVNNAGILLARKFADVKPQEVRKQFEVNCLSQFLTIGQCLPSMVEKNHGHIVNISSIAGIIGSVYLSDYCASKHAVMGLTESLSLELRVMKRTGVKTTLICPYYVETPLGAPIIAKHAKAQVFQAMAPLTAQETAKGIVDAILTDAVQTCIPSKFNMFFPLTKLLPHSASALLADHANEGMVYE